MPTDRQLPIEFRMSRGFSLTAVLLGILLLILGIWNIVDHRPTHLSIFGVASPTIGGVFLALVGLCMTVWYAEAFRAKRPVLTLDTEGLTYAGPFSSRRRIKWTEIVGIGTYRDRYGGGVTVEMHSGETTRFMALKVSASDLRNLMLRYAGPAIKPAGNST
jgi:hypothetical protein